MAKEPLWKPTAVPTAEPVGDPKDRQGAAPLGDRNFRAKYRLFGASGGVEAGAERVCFVDVRQRRQVYGERINLRMDIVTPMSIRGKSLAREKAPCRPSGYIPCR